MTDIFGKPVKNTSFDLKYQDNFYGNEGQFSDGRKPTKQQKAAVKDVVEDAVKSVQAVLDHCGIKYKGKLEVYVSDDMNRHADGKIFIDVKAKDQMLNDLPFTFNPFSYTDHEFAHELAVKIPKLREALTKFFNDHKIGEKVWNKADNTWTAEFKIPMPSEYCTLFRKTANGDEPLELLSMFFTCLTTDTSNRHDMERTVRTGTEFAKKYPEFFNAMMTILRSAGR